jgi:hypothetical protein
MSNDILRELAACKASDPYRTKAWIPHMRGKWMTVNVPAELWERIQAAAAAGVPACGACPGDGSICKTECRLAQESPPVPAAEWIQCDRCGKPWNRGAEPFGHAGVLVPDHQTVSQDTPMDPGKDAP